MNSSDKRRSLTSEIADETTKKNGFEERRLRRRLQDIEEHALKQQKKRNNEQLEYALENLSLEDLDTFNNLTRKILKSNFLPPINRKPRNGSHEDKRGHIEEMLTERLRGSKITRGSRNPRKLTRSLSADSGLISESANRKTTEKKPHCGPYSPFLLKRRLVGSFSDVPRRQPASNGGVTVDAPRSDEAKGSMTRRVHFADSESEKRTSRSKRTAQNKEFPGYVRDQGKIQHYCLSEAIEYKLKRRQLERKSTLESIVKDK